MTVSSPATPYHHGDLAATLERAAAQMLDTQSAATLSMRELARRAGVSHNAPYHHFGDRHGLLLAVAVRSLGDLLRVMQDAVAAAEGARAGVQAAGEAYVRFAIDHPGAFGAIFDPEICDPRDPTPEMRPLIDANDVFLREITRRLVPDVTESRLDVLVAALWAQVHGLAILVAAGHMPADIAPSALQFVVDAVEP